MTTTILLICHGLIAIGLLGAITHQAISVGLPARRPAASFVGRLRAVASPGYVGAVVILYLSAAIFGGIIYPEYRLQVSMTLEQMGLRSQSGVFELKEHFVAVGLGLLPAYWFAWHQPLDPRYAIMRAALTMMLAFIVWWSFLVGHILNNIRGFGG